MAYQKEKVDQFEHALCTLEEVLALEKNDIVRDATIQRFEYTVEVFWKALKIYLRETAGIDAATPKTVLREAGAADVLTVDEVILGLAMIDDRNETSSVYPCSCRKLWKNSGYSKFLRSVRSPENARRLKIRPQSCVDCGR